MKYGHLLNNQDALESLGKGTFSDNPAVKIKVARILRRTSVLLEDALDVQRQISMHYYEKDEEGQPIVKDERIRIENPEAYAKDMQALYEAEIPKFPEEDLLTEEDLLVAKDNLSAETLARLWFLVNDVQEIESTKSDLLSRIPGLPKV